MSEQIFVVDSESMNEKVLSLLLTEGGYHTVASAGGEDAIQKIMLQDTGLAIISVELNGDEDGYELLARARSHGFQGPVIFTSTDASVSNKLKAFQLGADDFVIKPFDMQEMMARVQSVLRRFKVAEQAGEGRFIRVGDAELDVGKLTYKSELVPPTVLTPTEMRILQCLMYNHGITISRSTLINRVWGFDFVGDSNRVDVYVRRIRRKIEVNQHEHEYLHTVRGLGYVFKVARNGNSKSSVDLEKERTAPSL